MGASILVEKDGQKRCKKHTKKINDNCKKCSEGKEIGLCENNSCVGEKWAKEVSLKEVALELSPENKKESVMLQSLKEECSSVG